MCLNDQTHVCKRFCALMSMCARLCMQAERQRCLCVTFSKQGLKQLQHAGCVQRHTETSYQADVLHQHFPLLDVVEPGSAAATVMYYCSKLICLICNSLRSLCQINKNNQEYADLQQCLAAHFPTYRNIHLKINK